MKQQKGSIGLAIGGVLVTLIILVVLGIGIYASYYNLGNSSEKNLQAAQENAENVLAQYGQKAMEAAQVPQMYAEDFKDAMTSMISARYGDGGSAAITQVLTEAQVNFDPSMYATLQRLIEAGRNDFQAAQQRQIDIKRQYETALGTLFGGTILKFAGYPKINLKDFDIVSTARASNAMETKQEEVIKFR